VIKVDFNNIITYIACIFFLFIFGRIFIIPIKTILKLVINSILGGLTIFIINLIGSFFNFHIGLNIITSIFVGILGIPGVVVIVIIKLLLG
jgi:inhibitor of the pro-sigma K processing machinery